MSAWFLDSELSICLEISCLSLSTVVLNSRNRLGNLWLLQKNAPG